VKGGGGGECEIGKRASWIWGDGGESREIGKIWGKFWRVSSIRFRLPYPARKPDRPRLDG
jgi:hypothetical protein